jgi:hypothetical protein
MSSILAAIAAIPRIVTLLEQLVVSINSIGDKIEQVRFDAELKDAFEKAKSNYDTRPIERLLGRKIL